MNKLTLNRLAHAAALAVTLAVAPWAGAPIAQAAAPMAKASAPAYHRIMVGAFEVTALSDGTVDLPVDQLLHEPPAAVNRALARSYLKAPLETSVNAYLVNTGSKLVLIDAGAGALFGPTLGKLVTNLKAAGYTPEQVDEVYLTHLHPDHVGGIASQGAATFPNATVRADRHDAEEWLSTAKLNAAPEAGKGFYQGAMASLQPYLGGQRFQAFDGSTPLVPGIRSVASAGHTPGHTSYVIESEGQALMLVGDLIHVAAVQFDAPQVTIAFDSDPKAAGRTRATVFEAAAKDGVLIGASHLQFPGLGHLRKVGKGYQWVPVNFTQVR